VIVKGNRAAGFSSDDVDRKWGGGGHARALNSYFDTLWPQMGRGGQLRRRGPLTAEGRPCPPWIACLEWKEEGEEGEN
jgi:hypothetical protein